jgi:hypothetical protein
VSATTSRGTGGLIEHAELRARRAVGQEDELAAAERLGQRGAEIAKNVELHLQRFAVVHVGLVLALPEERFSAADDVQPGRVDAAAAEQRDVLGRKIVAHDADQHDRREVARRVGEIRGRPAENPLARLRGRFDRIEGDRTNNQKRHQAGFFCKVSLVSEKYGPHYR